MPGHDVRVEIHRGDAGLGLLAGPDLQRGWRVLHQACPWSTAFQDVSFADVWYRTYGARFEPVVVAGWTDGALSGLLLLAVTRDGTRLVHVGAEHAEYQVWLAVDDRFIGAALDALAAEFPRRGLQLLFVPPGVPFAPPERWRTRCFRRPTPVPLLATNPADTVRESMRKKANRSKLHRLAGRGTITLERVTDDAAFEALLDEIIPIYDLRQGAAYGVLPFRGDDLKRAFYLALKRETDLLHATAMRVDDQLIAAHVGVRSRNTVLVGMPAQSPRHARHSAGKLLFFELALLLEKEGLAALDLTPGGEYKERFASHFAEASALRIVFSAADAWRYRQQRRLIDSAKRCGVSTDWVKGQVGAARHTLARLATVDLPFKVARRLKRAAWYETELRLYRFPREHPRPGPGAFRMARDRFEDLTAYAPAETWQPATGPFLGRAMKRLEGGEHCYTHVEDGVLAHWGWLIDRQASAFLDEVGQSWTLPAGSAVVYDFHTHPRFRGRGLYSSALGRMVTDALAMPGVEQVYVSVEADNAPSRRAVEKIGFVYDRSLFVRRRLGSVRRWSEAAAEAGGAGHGSDATPTGGAATLRGARSAVLKTLGALRLDQATMRSPWRQNRVLILGYHGTSLDDEHDWDPEISMPLAVLRRRLELIREAGCTVLPLDDAVRRLYGGALPPRSVVLTFDDGPYDFYAQAFPLIESFGYPVTVYLTTYYAEFNRPVYDTMGSYLLWKGRGRLLDWPEVLGDRAGVTLTASGRSLVAERLRRFAREHRLSARDKDALLIQLAARLDIDYDALVRRRLLHLMTMAEAGELARRGVDFQLHTHRHRVSLHEAVFDREVRDNRERLRPLRSSEATHFCYPGSVQRPEFRAWPRARNIASATTCSPGMASPLDDPLLLPRYVDTAAHTEAEFRSWLTGVAGFLPRRRHPEAVGQFHEELGA